MKYFYLTLVWFTCIAKANGQEKRRYYVNVVVVEITKERKSLIVKAQVTSDDPASDSTWVQFLEKELNRTIPKGKRVKKGKHVVKARFIISKDGGSTADVACINDPGYGLCEQVVKVIKKSPYK